MSKPVQVQVELQNLEEFYAIKNSHGENVDFSTASGEQLFKHLRHNCTNYDAVLDTIREQSVDNKVSELHLRLVKQSAAEVIIEHFKNDNEILQVDLEATRQAKNTLKNKLQDLLNEIGKLLQKLGVDSISAGINALDDLLLKVANAEQAEEAYKRLEKKHQNSSNAFGRLNDTYRVHEILTIDYLEKQELDPQIITNLKKLYKTQSPRTAIPTYCNFSQAERDYVLKKIKPKLRYTDIKKLD